MSEIGVYRLLSLKYYYHDDVTSLPCQLITGYDLCTNHSRPINKQPGLISSTGT